MAASRVSHARRRGTAARGVPPAERARRRHACADAGGRAGFADALPAAVVAVAVASVLALSGCTTFGPWSRDAGTAAPESSDATVEAAEPAKPAEHEHTAGEEPGPAPALEVAVLDPGDYERGISRRKQKLASALDEAPSDADRGYYMDVQEAQLRQALNGTDIGMLRDDPYLRLRISGTQAFATGSAELNPVVEESLATVAEVLEDYRLTLVIVHGHTDAAGDADVNQRLSEARAVAVARRLVESGLAAERIVTVGHGESRPLAHDTSPENRWPDRRIEIELDLIGR